MNFDVKINDNNYYSPKAMVFDKTDVKGDDIFATKPVIMFEILTHKNKHLLNAKFEHYQKIDTLQEYVLVDLNNPQILVYRKDNHWQKELLSFDDKLYLKSVDYTVKVADIYENIEF
nr:Uma2 family endonuclease [Moraxella bovis]